MQTLQGGSGSVSNPDSHSAQTTVSRRGYSYTALVSWCSVDDSKDGYGTPLSSVPWCSDSSSTGTADSLPQDLKRITATITYSQGGKTRTLAETITMSATGGGVVDGTYTIGATSIDALGNRGQQITLTVRLARGAPLTAQNLVGGYNYVNPTGVGNGGTLVVELAWDANPEGSVTGYDVCRGCAWV